MYIGDDIDGNPVKVGDVCRVVRVNNPRTKVKVGQMVIPIGTIGPGAAVISRDSDGFPRLVAETDRDLQRIGPDFFTRRGSTIVSVGDEEPCDV